MFIHVLNWSEVSCNWLPRISSSDSDEPLCVSRRNEDDVDVDEITADLNRTFNDFQEEIKCAVSTLFTDKLMYQVEIMFYLCDGDAIAGISRIHSGPW